VINAVPIPQHLLCGVQHVGPMCKAVDLEMGREADFPGHGFPDVEVVDPNHGLHGLKFDADGFEVHGVRHMLHQNSSRAAKQAECRFQNQDTDQKRKQGINGSPP
jgi:hypothetical protein